MNYGTLLWTLLSQQWYLIVVNLVIDRKINAGFQSLSGLSGWKPQQAFETRNRWSKNQINIFKYSWNSCCSSKSFTWNGKDIKSRDLQIITSFESRIHIHEPDSAYPWKVNDLIQEHSQSHSFTDEMNCLFMQNIWSIRIMQKLFYKK